jgi:hypothetical protein
MACPRRCDVSSGLRKTRLERLAVRVRVPLCVAPGSATHWGKLNDSTVVLLAGRKEGTPVVTT